MVKCSDCGFLAVMSQENGSYVEANLFYRKEGFQGMQRDLVFCEPHCAIHCQSIHSEPLVADGGGTQLTDPGGGVMYLHNAKGEDVTDKAVLSVIGKPRSCDGFFFWIPGFSPKEHKEMLDREKMLKWQADREDADRKWKSRQEWNFVIMAGMFTILGAIIVAIVSLLR